MSKSIASVVVLVLVFLAGIWVHARTAFVGSGGQAGSAFAPTVIAGPDLGFRVEVYKGSTPIGRLVVRIDGKWIEVEDAVVTKKLTSR